MGTKALGICLAEKTLRDRVRGEGQNKDPREAHVKIIVTGGKGKKKRWRDKDWPILSPGTPSISSDSVRLEE